MTFQPCGRERVDSRTAGTRRKATRLDAVFFSFSFFFGVKKTLQVPEETTLSDRERESGELQEGSRNVFFSSLIPRSRRKELT